MLNNAYDVTPRLRPLLVPLSRSFSSYRVCLYHLRVGAVVPGHHSRHRQPIRGQVVQGATVLIIDEATNATRTLETDAEGR